MCNLRYDSYRRGGGASSGSSLCCFPYFLKTHELLEAFAAARMSGSVEGIPAGTGRESSGRRFLCRINLGKTKNCGFSNDTPIPDQSTRRQGPLVPLLPYGPSGSCRLKGPEWVSSGENIWPSSPRRTKGGQSRAGGTRQKKSRRGGTGRGGFLFLIVWGSREFCQHDPNERTYSQVSVVL